MFLFKLLYYFLTIVSVLFFYIFIFSQCYLLLFDFTLSVTPSLPVNFWVKLLPKAMTHSHFVHRKLYQVYNFYQVICCPVGNITYSKTVWRVESGRVLVIKVFTDFLVIIIEWFIWFKEMHGIWENYDQNLKLADLLNNTEHDTSLSCGCNPSL